MRRLSDEVVDDAERPSTNEGREPGALLTRPKTMGMGRAFVVGVMAGGIVIAAGCADPEVVDGPVGVSQSSSTAPVADSSDRATVSCASAHLDGPAAKEVRALQRQVDSNIDELISTEEYEEMLEQFADAVGRVLDGTCEEDLEANCSAIEIDCRVYIRDGVEIGGTDDEVRDRFDVAVADGIVRVIP